MEQLERHSVAKTSIVINASPGACAPYLSLRTTGDVHFSDECPYLIVYTAILQS